MRIPIGWVWLSVVCAIGACDDPDPVSGGESGGEVVDDDGGGSTGTATSGAPTTASASSTTTSTSADPTTGPTPTTMDPSASAGDSSSGGPDDTSSGCMPGTSGCACDEGTCDGDLSCVEGVCVQGGDCGVDIYEDNNTEDAAADLGTIDDDDGNAVTITAVLEGDEVDWFTYAGTDSLLDSVNPARSVETTGALRVCKFAECNNDLFATEVACPEGTVQTESPAGRPGCCGDDSFEIELNCLDVVDDDAQIYMRFDQGLAACTQYTLEFHY